MSEYGNRDQPNTIPPQELHAGGESVDFESTDTFILVSSTDTHLPTTTPESFSLEQIHVAMSSFEDRVDTLSAAHGRLPLEQGTDARAEVEETFDYILKQARGLTRSPLEEGQSTPEVSNERYEILECDLQLIRLGVLPLNELQDFGAQASEKIAVEIANIMTASNQDSLTRSEITALHHSTRKVHLLKRMLFRSTNLQMVMPAKEHGRILWYAERGEELLDEFRAKNANSAKRKMPSILESGEKYTAIAENQERRLEQLKSRYELGLETWDDHREVEQLPYLIESTRRTSKHLQDSIDVARYGLTEDEAFFRREESTELYKLELRRSRGQLDHVGHERLVYLKANIVNDAQTSATKNQSKPGRDGFRISKAEVRGAVLGMVLATDIVLGGLATTVRPETATNHATIQESIAEDTSEEKVRNRSETPHVYAASSKAHPSEALQKDLDWATEKKPGLTGRLRQAARRIMTIVNRG